MIDTFIVIFCIVFTLLYLGYRQYSIYKESKNKKISKKSVSKDDFIKDMYNESIDKIDNMYNESVSKINSLYQTGKQKQLEREVDILSNYDSYIN